MTEPSEQASTAIIDTLHERHHIRSAHRCSCGWEGDNATVHIIDTLGLRRFYMPDSIAEDMDSDTWDWWVENAPPLFELTGENGRSTDV